MFNEEREQSKFKWQDLGDIPQGRPSLGKDVPVLLYRLLQFTLRDVLIKRYDAATARDIVIEAGKLAGYEFCKSCLNLDLDYEDFLTELQTVMKDFNIGILTIEKADFEVMEFQFAVAEDLDCSGVSASDETICSYDEGFIKGVLEAYTEREFSVTEIDCWADGSRVCRFKIDLIRL